MPPVRDLNAVLLVSPDVAFAASVVDWLRGDGLRVEIAPESHAALAAFGTRMPGAVCLDLPGAGPPELALLQAFHAARQGPPLVVRVPGDQVGYLLAASRGLVFDYLVRPVDRHRLSTTVRNALDRHRLALRLAELEARLSGEETLAAGGAASPAGGPRVGWTADIRPERLPTLNLQALERRAIEEALIATRGRLTEVTRLLGIGRTTLYRKLKDYGLRPSNA